MKLLTAAIRKKLPTIGSTDGTDPMVICKFFTPDSSWTWYITEYDGQDEFFGLVDGFEAELGYFSLREIESARGPLGLKIERDLWWKPRRLSEVQAQLARRDERRAS
jgi:hypothetical protein